MTFVPSQVRIYACIRQGRERTVREREENGPRGIKSIARKLWGEGLVDLFWEPLEFPGEGFGRARDGLFALPEGEKANAKRQQRLDCLFLDRQGEKGIASARHVLMIAFPSTGRGKRQSQAHAMFP